ncbi:MAG: hypothetical protein KJ630_24230 [Proteobacteria bacterium]|nr:hypothetical protein [Pseudomonadota bacterium]
MKNDKNERCKNLFDLTQVNGIMVIVIIIDCQRPKSVGAPTALNVINPDKTLI